MSNPEKNQMSENSEQQEEQLVRMLMKYRNLDAEGKRYAEGVADALLHTQKVEKSA